MMTHIFTFFEEFWSKPVECCMSADRYQKAYLDVLSDDIPGSAVTEYTKDCQYDIPLNWARTTAWELRGTWMADNRILERCVILHILCRGTQATLNCCPCCGEALSLIFCRQDGERMSRTTTMESPGLENVSGRHSRAMLLPRK